jgi:hypothetical protein
MTLSGVHTVEALLCDPHLKRQTPRDCYERVQESVALCLPECSALNLDCVVHMRTTGKVTSYKAKVPQGREA